MYMGAQTKYRWSSVFVLLLPDGYICKGELEGFWNTLYTSIA